MVVYDSIKTYNTSFNHPTLHPLISVLDLGKGDLRQRTQFRIDFYAIIIKDSKCGDLRYGLKHYDYDEGSIVFYGPGQIAASEPEGEWFQPYGTALVFHPDLINGTSLSKQMPDYSFFGYDSYEALHVSEKERALVDICFDNIVAEIKQNLDRHSKKIIVANIELLLKYCSRFYDRQFITRENYNGSIMGQFQDLLTNYLLSDKLQIYGIPSVGYFSEKLNLSANYFGDLLKKEAGKTAIEFIHLRMMDLAKEKIIMSNKNISEIAYELGFKYPQHFTRLFKQKVGVSPMEFRSLN